MAHRLRHYPFTLGRSASARRLSPALSSVIRLILMVMSRPDLDSKNGEAVMELLRDCTATATVCMVTHDQRYANFAERTIHLFDGRIVEGRRKARRS